MKTPELIKADIKFKVDGVLVEFSVIHNLPKTFGASLDCALTNWLARTDKFTAKSLCKYIMSKNTGVICMTEKQFERLNKLS